MTWKQFVPMTTWHKGGKNELFFCLTVILLKVYDFLLCLIVLWQELEPEVPLTKSCLLLNDPGLTGYGIKTTAAVVSFNV